MCFLVYGLSFLKHWRILKFVYILILVSDGYNEDFVKLKENFVVSLAKNQTKFKYDCGIQTVNFAKRYFSFSLSSELNNFMLFIIFIFKI